MLYQLQDIDGRAAVVEVEFGLDDRKPRDIGWYHLTPGAFGRLLTKQPFQAHMFTGNSDPDLAKGIICYYAVGTEPPTLKPRFVLYQFLRAAGSLRAAYGEGWIYDNSGGTLSEGPMSWKSLTDVPSIFVPPKPTSARTPLEELLKNGVPAVMARKY
jgi:hypothetical protein